jgi:hypothetical protein
VDSTILLDTVATQDTITQPAAAVRRVARTVPRAAEKVAAVCIGHDYGAEDSLRAGARCPLDAHVTDTDSQRALEFPPLKASRSSHGGAIDFSDAEFSGGTVELRAA